MSAHPSHVGLGPGCDVHPTAVLGHGGDAPTVLGPGCRIGPFCVVHAGAELGPECTLSAHCVVYPGVKSGRGLFLGDGACLRQEVRLGDGVTVGSGSVVMPRAALADGATVHSLCMIGEYSSVGPGAWIGPGAVLLNSIHPKPYACPDKARCDREGAPAIGRAARVGGGAVISPFVTVGDHAVIGAGAVVVHPVPPGAVMAGSPARHIRDGRDVGCRLHEHFTGVYDPKHHGESS